MNNDLYMNDTLDNFAFTQTEDLFSKPTTLINEKSTQIRLSVERKEKAIDEISFDDSIFLSQSLSFSADSDNNVNDHTLQDNKSTNTADANNIRDTVASEQLEARDTCKIESPTCPAALRNLQKNVTDCDLCKLSSWGLPKSVLERYKLRNIINMFPWQVECLSNLKVLNNSKNLIYSAPTSAGKTLVAEILAFKTIFERQKKVIFILPFVSIVREKMYYFQDILASSGIRVEGFMGSYNPPGGFNSVEFAVCTIEKANSLINRLLEDSKLSDIGAMLVDEIHLLGDPSRGYLLELLLTKLKYIAKKDENVNIQVIGMSATLPNLGYLAKWLDAELYTTNFRPIPLHEQAHVCGEIYDNSLKLVRKLLPLPEIGTDTDNILQLCLETIKDSCSVLIFCPTKNWCENLAQQIATAFFKIGSSNSEWGQLLRLQLNTDLIMELLGQLKYCPVGLDLVLRKTVSFGVAFHHAGLTMDERDIIEGAFRNGALRVLVATSTLSSGVNLPARRVIIRTPHFHGRPIDALTYRQMIGRAGRMGKDALGESFLICQKNDYKIAKELMSAELSPVESCLEGAGKLKRAILEVIASGVALSPGDIALFTKCTLLAVEDENTGGLNNPIEEAVDFLKNNEFIRLQKQGEESMYVATSLGKACLSSSIPPDEGLALFTELEKARQCFVLETELHLIYLVTPYSACNSWGNIDWMLYLDLWVKLPTTMKRVGELVGVQESYIINATRGKIQTNTSKLYHKSAVHKRFFVALALQDLVNEKPLQQVCAKFNCNRGMLQSLQQSASSFAGMVTSFSHQLGWSSVEILLSQFQDRMQFGVSRELLDLMRLSILNGPMARILYNSGIENITQLANSDAVTVENILHKTLPFEMKKERDGESEFDKNQRNKFRIIWVTGKEGLTEREAAEMLVTNARKYLQLEMGLAEAKWESDGHGLQCPKEIETTSTNSILNKNKTMEEASKENASIITDANPANNCILELPQSDIANDQKSFKIPSKSFSKKEVSLLLLSPSQAELNTSDSSVFSSHSNINTSLDIIQSDQSFFDDSFNLRLSDSDKDSSKTSDVKTSNDNLTKENNLSTELNISDDILSSSLTEEVPNVSKKRKNKSKDTLGTPSKKKKNKANSRNSKSNRETTRDDISNATFISNKNHKEPIKHQILDVCQSLPLWDFFEKELKERKHFCLSLACSRAEERKPLIGMNVIGPQNARKTEEKMFSYKNSRLDGIAVTWNGSQVFYCPLIESKVIRLLKLVLSNEKARVSIFDAKEQIKLLYFCCGIDFEAKIDDPKIADWLVDPEGKEKTLTGMALVHSSERIMVAPSVSDNKGVGSVGINFYIEESPRIRASDEAVVTFYLMNSLRLKLTTISSNYIRVYDNEMDTLRCLAKMEIYGISVRKDLLETLVDTLRSQMEAVEKAAFSLAGRHFNFSSSMDVAKILGMSRGKKVSTRKQILEQNKHPISALVLEWRKMNSILTKTICPLVKITKDNRIRGCYIMRTATGRITMHEPNLQNVAKDFTINALGKESKISSRSTFQAPDDYVMISADYCQLELRILAHLSQDATLCSIMKRPGDVFRSIAAKWNKVEEAEVTDSMRQNTKQICYGIIYGMTSRTLSKQLGIEEGDAATFMETFKNTYPGIKVFINNTIENCRSKGYVETLFGRRRYLPHISEQTNKRGQAERQAVNTTVQGSAADIAKKAMATIENEFRKIFIGIYKPNLVLHLHDELLYEVPLKYQRKVMEIVKVNMENCVQLTVPFPVKLKTGKSWGEMTEYVL